LLFLGAAGVEVEVRPVGLVQRERGSFLRTISSVSPEAGPRARRRGSYLDSAAYGVTPIRAIRSAIEGRPWPRD
jgi:hypothetical protein